MGGLDFVFGSTCAVGLGSCQCVAFETEREDALGGKCLLRRGKKLVSGCMLFVVVGSTVISPEFVLILPLIHLVPLFSVYFNVCVLFPLLVEKDQKQALPSFMCNKDQINKNDSDRKSVV